MPSPAWIPLTDHVAQVPVVHGVQAYADEVRRAVLDYRPTAIALELPATLASRIEHDLIDALPEIALLIWKLEDGRALMLPGDPCDPLIEGMRLALENGIPFACVDIDAAGADEPYLPLPDDPAMARLGAGRFTEKVTAAIGHREATARDRFVASGIARLAAGHDRVLYIGGFARIGPLSELLPAGDPSGDAPDPGPSITAVSVERLSQRRLGHVLRELPAVAWLYETFRAGSGAETRFPAMEALERILRNAAVKYEEEYREAVNLTEWRSIFQYGRNLAVVRGMLRPRLLELMTAARGCVDDDFAALFLEEALAYPPNGAVEDGDPEADDGGPRHRHISLDLHCQLGGEMVRLLHSYPHPGLEELSFEFRRRPTEHEKLLWRMQFSAGVWSGNGICSWPPEDDFVEEFFHSVRDRAFRQVGEEHTTTEEFTTSLLDGLDVRETMRRWHEGRLIVRRERIPPGRIGPVVVIWRDVPLASRGVWKTCLYAEHDRESDLALYSVLPGEEMVGPGISRCEYHGVLSVFPAIGIPNVWGMDLLRRWRTCARLLVASAIVLSEERYVAVLAPFPPDAELRTFAREHGRALVYLPIGTFARSLLKRVSQFHLLSGHAVRQWAGDYIPRI